MLVLKNYFQGGGKGVGTGGGEERGREEKERKIMYERDKKNVTTCDINIERGGVGGGGCVTSP